jgi:hypothetical protein
MSSSNPRKNAYPRSNTAPTDVTVLKTELTSVLSTRELHRVRDAQDTKCRITHSHIPIFRCAGRKMFCTVFSSEMN